MAEYSGSDWIESNLKHIKPEVQMSQIGRDVADLLGELFLGIYHLNSRWLFKTDWSNNSYIKISIGGRTWATFDYDNLTRLVFLAHHLAIRVDLYPTTRGYVCLLFHQRKRGGDIYQRHPTLDEAVAQFKKNVSIPEFQTIIE